MTAKITCPKCQVSKEVEVPNNKTLIAYTCYKCDQRSNATKNSCIICSFSDTNCTVPHLQA